MTMNFVDLGIANKTIAYRLRPRTVTTKITGPGLIQSALHLTDGFLRGTAVERRSLAGELSPSCARPVADG